MRIEKLIEELQEFQKTNPGIDCMIRNIEGVYNDEIRISMHKPGLNFSETLLITS